MLNWLMDHWQHALDAGFIPWVAGVSERRKMSNLNQSEVIKTVIATALSSLIVAGATTFANVAVLDSRLAGVVKEVEEVRTTHSMDLSKLERRLEELRGDMISVRAEVIATQLEQARRTSAVEWAATQQQRVDRRR
jgi:hypothetical protein